MVENEKAVLIGYRPRVIVKLRDYIQAPYQDGVETVLEAANLVNWSSLRERFPGLTLRRLLNAAPPDKIQQLVEKARQDDKSYSPGRLFSYYVADCPPGVPPGTLVEALNALAIVEKAYYDPPPGNPPSVDPSDDDYAFDQGYLGPAPDGINVRLAWNYAGGDGAGQGLIDLETGWTLNHEDLVSHGPTILSPCVGPSMPNEADHGTAVLGIIAALDNAVGCVGITPHLDSVRVVSFAGATNSRANAILAALTASPPPRFGDVLLLETQVTEWFGPHFWDNVPAEVLDDVYEMIRLATALGIVVVAAAGNGNTCLDDFTDAAGRHLLDRNLAAECRDSGAILVAAATSGAAHARVGNTNYGNRIDCYAWGENIRTCRSDYGGATHLYDPLFGQTSGAAAIVAGAALAVQGLMQASRGHRLSPRQLRTILAAEANGTLSANPAMNRIGVMPDLAKILGSGVLNLLPDVYLRDHVGDTGDPHAVLTSASPDIIVRPAAVADPQASFGEGSGTENSATLGSDATTGQDNHVYVRVRNRGGTPAAPVQARVFWAPVATLLTPNTWTLIGAVTLPSVPTGDLLTVSPALVWPAAAVPPTGPYAFIALLNAATDPAPEPTVFQTFEQFRRFVCENNNVTLRNFTVVPASPLQPGDPVNAPAAASMAFDITGAADSPQRMRLEVVTRLPHDAKVTLEAPTAFLLALGVPPPHLREDPPRRTAHLRLGPSGRHVLGEMTFPAGLRVPARLHVELPRKWAVHTYEVSVRQLHEGLEVGRVTFRVGGEKK